MLCPYCQRQVGAFAKVPAGATLRCPLADCPGQDFDVPNLYTRDYDRHPPVAMSILGPTGHGKTMFIEALLTHLERHVNWPGFSTQWMDEVGMREIRERLRTLRQQGQVADATQRVFPRPKILRLRNVPRLGGRQLLMYDTSGESFSTSENMLESGRYVRNSPAILWLVSVTEFEYPEQLADLTTTYAHAMELMGADPREQGMVLVLTKGDLLLEPDAGAAAGLPPLPPAAREFLENDDLNPAGDAWGRLEAVHVALDGWLQKTPLRNTINLLKEQFRTLKLTIVSAQGRPAIDQALTMDLMPRGVLAPLLWLCRVGHPGAWVETKFGNVFHFDLPSALAAAPPDATVRLEPGTATLTEPLIFSRPVTLVGAGPASSRVVSSAEKFGFGFRSPFVKVSDLSLAHVGTAPGDVVRVVGGTAELTNVEIRGAVAGQPAAFGDGVLVLGTSKVRLTNCHLRENAARGLSVRDAQASAHLIRCTVTRNGDAGLLVLQGDCRVEAGTVSENAKYGVELRTNGSLALENTVLANNGKAGVRVAPGAAGTVRLNEVTAEGHAERGVDVQGTVVLTAAGLICRGNKAAGVNFKEESRGTISGGLLTGNTYGIIAAGKSRCEVHSATVSGNTDSGILFAEQATGVCVNSVLAGNGNGGLRIFGTAAVAHRGNTFDRNAGGEIIQGQGATLTIAPDPDQPIPLDLESGPGAKRKKRGWFG